MDGSPGFYQLLLTIDNHRGLSIQNVKSYFSRPVSVFWNCSA